MSPLPKTLLAALLLRAACACAGTVEVQVSAVAGGTGMVRVAVCDRERFLKQCPYTASAAARPGAMVLEVEGVPSGSWAVLAFEDANGNGKLDRNLLGIPSENYGFSRDARGSFGPPAFDDAAIDVREERAVAVVKLH